MSSRTRPSERTEVNGGRRHGRHHRGIRGNGVNYDGNVERPAQRERNDTLTTERTAANRQLTTLTEHLNNAQTAAIENQNERLALCKQLEELQNARAILQSKIERLQPQLYEAKQAIYDVDTELDTMISNLKADNTQLRGQNKAFEVDNTQLSRRNEGLEADKTRLSRRNKGLEADKTLLSRRSKGLEASNTQLRDQLSNYGELLLKAQLECKKLQETAHKQGTTERAINYMSITPPTTPEVLYAIPGAIPGQFPVDDNPQPDERIIAEECAMYNVANSLSTPEVGTANQR